MVYTRVIMEHGSTLLTVALISLLAAISPGPDFFIVVKNSLSHSRRWGLYTALGISLALFIHLAYTIFGLGVLLAEGTLLYLVVKYLGASYLFYIGLKGLISSFKPASALTVAYESGIHQSGAVALRQGFLTNLLNPKCALFFISLFSQFIEGDTPLRVKLELACINWTISLAWFCFLVYLITGKYMMERIGLFRKWIDRTMGLALVLLSLKMFFS